MPVAASDVWPLGRCGCDIGVGQSGVGRLSIGGTDFGAYATVVVVRAQIHLRCQSPEFTSCAFVLLVGCAPGRVARTQVGKATRHVLGVVKCSSQFWTFAHCDPFGIYNLLSGESTVSAEGE